MSHKFRLILLTREMRLLSENGDLLKICASSKKLRTVFLAKKMQMLVNIALRVVFVALILVRVSRFVAAHRKLGDLV